ncbi:MobF family relaxase [Hamadaea sp. NPDC051192]|uniref:MobF family relaxase n=1 Tax=Hamadaea sp. NPDC051192 TaxID=3154940 RepID=UPI0034422190
MTRIDPLRVSGEVTAMAWVTTLGPDMAQVEYRLEHAAGCALDGQHARAVAQGTATDAQIAYRLGDELALEWIGGGLADVGIDAGTAMTEHQKQWARALMDGRDPRTGERLVDPKQATDPRAKLSARPLLDAVDAAAAFREQPVSAIIAGHGVSGLYGRALRGVQRKGEAHRVPVADLERIAIAAGIDLDQLYEAQELATARQHAADRVVVGNRGYDLTLDTDKSVGVLMAMADQDTADELEQVLMASVRRTVAAMEQWAGYGMRGHHGDGQTGQRMATSGLLGWTMVHRTARPVAGAAPDPHWHAHVTLANLVHGQDGKWSTVGAGGRDLHRHAHAADALFKAQVRAETSRRWGIGWERDPATGAWKIAEIPQQARELFAKRHNQIADTLARLGLDPDGVTTGQGKMAAAVSREAKQTPGAGGDLREDWQAQARAAGLDPASIRAAAMPGPDTSPSTPTPPTPQQVAQWVFRDGQQETSTARRVFMFQQDGGLTVHRKVVTRADVLAAVLDALPGGVATLDEAEALTEQVLQIEGYAVAMPDAGATHLTNSARYTTADIVAAERDILAAAREGFDAGVAVADPQAAATALDLFEAGRDIQLSGEQRQVLERLLHAGHQVDTVIGVAGSGKTTIMDALRSAYEAENLTVRGASNAAVAAANLQAESGIRSSTVASWLARIEHGTGLADVDVLVVDEAATVDDRQMAQLLRHTRAHGVKVVAIGDPLQLKAPGIGGTFTAVHEVVGGLTLTENRRQRDEAERAALVQWRSGKLAEALTGWSGAGRIHAAADAAHAHATMLARWEQVRQQWEDPHDRIAQLLLMAGTNADVDRLNAAAQAIRLAAGELPGDDPHVYVLAGGQRVAFHVGDQVLLRLNERRADSPDLLNGYRGVIVGVDADRQMRVQWRATGPDGPQLVTASVSPTYIADGGLSLGYALTVAKAQGLTTEYAITYGAGLDPNTLYPAMTRAREQNHLILPRDLVEDEATLARLGPPQSPAEELDRAVAAYGRALAQADATNELVLSELEGVNLTPPTARPQQTPRDTVRAERAAARVREEHEAVDGRGWRHRRHGKLTDAQLTRAILDADRRETAAQARADDAQRQAEARRSEAAAGQGPHARALRTQRDNLERAITALGGATAAGQQASRARARARELAEDLARPRWAQVMRGINPDQARAELQQTTDTILRNDQMASTEQARAAHHTRAAGLPEGADVRAALADLRERWAQASRDAVTRDVDDAAQPPTPTDAERSARLVAAAFPQDRASAAELRTEQATRQQLEPVQAAAEADDRRQQLAADARAQREREHQRQHEAQRAAEQERHGPDLGL